MSGERVKNKSVEDRLRTIDKIHTHTDNYLLGLEHAGSKEVADYLRNQMYSIWLSAQSIFEALTREELGKDCPLVGDSVAKATLERDHREGGQGYG